MDGFKIKEAMEQVHISSEMQEEIMENVQNRIERGNKDTRAWNRRKMAATAAAFVLAAGVVGFPVRAFVTSVVRERMEKVPKEEVQDIGDMVQEQHDVLTDGFSREYSDTEKKRSKELWQAYENGTFPEKAIEQVDNAEAAPEGTLCYIRSTGVFNLPLQEMTDEEMLEIIDFQHKMSYAIEQSGVVTEEEKAAYKAEEERLEKTVQDADGISGDEAVEIARKQLAADLGGRAEELELMTDSSGNGATLLDILDIAEEGELESKAGVIYDVGFGDPNDKSFTYGYIIDAVDGSILYTWKSK